MSASPARYDRIPALGENNDAILRELGYDAAAIESLRQEQVI
jgi:crotonobetainyl-CoA:carnitine CoA-transferase CaiB-like acyl-CoA transferase